VFYLVLNETIDYDISERNRRKKMGKERIDEIIARIKAERDLTEKTAALIESLEALKRELGENPSDSEISEGIRKTLRRQSQASAVDDDEIVELSEEDKARLAKAVSEVRKYLDEDDWRYTEHRPNRPDIVVFEMGYTVDKCSLRLRIQIETNPDLCRFYVTLPITADPTFEYPLCKAIAAKNYNTALGALQYDEDDGEVSFKYAFPIMFGIHKDEFMRMLAYVTQTAAKSYDDIRRICVGRFKSREINEILKKVEVLITDINNEDD
jgi:hypothetical protein